MCEHRDPYWAVTLYANGGRVVQTISTILDVGITNALRRAENEGYLAKPESPK